MNFDEYAEKWDRDPYSNFAVACFDGNTMEELENASHFCADEGDMKGWDISREEWHDAIKTALEERKRCIKEDPVYFAEPE